ncbi:MAG: 4Fe-4S dicluster domain-containing protein [Thermodesulfobacteriota bacterium]|nr:4Fe-4S dicluster domain-containing protein [Thermodesulfobacteriota bacterium]
MSKYHLYQDTDKCIGCHTCEIQCKSNKSLPVGPKLCEIIEIGPKMIDGVPKAAYVYVACFHCEKPWCIEACPAGAMQRRAKDGIVFVNHDLCVGCKSCISACPWGAPQWDPKRCRVVKCDFCMDRLDQGLQPACVTVCTTGCLHFDVAENINPIKRERHARLEVEL